MCKDNSLLSVTSSHHQWDQFTASNNLSLHLGPVTYIIFSQEATLDSRQPCLGWGWSSPCQMGCFPEWKNIGLHAGEEWEVARHMCQAAEGSLQTGKKASQDGLWESQGAVQKRQVPSSVLGNNHLCCFGVEYEQQSSCSARKHPSTVIKLLQSKVLCFWEGKMKTIILGYSRSVSFWADIVIITTEKE